MLVYQRVILGSWFEVPWLEETPSSHPKRALKNGHSPIRLPHSRNGIWTVRLRLSRSEPTNGRLVFKRTTKTGQRKPLAGSGAGKSSVFICQRMGILSNWGLCSKPCVWWPKGNSFCNFVLEDFWYMVGINAIPQKSRRFCWNENLNHQSVPWYEQYKYPQTNPLKNVTD